MAKLLTDNHVELIMKSMKQPLKSSRPKAKPTSKKPKSKKTKKSGSSKTGSAEKAEKTPAFNDDFMLRMGADGEMPSDEEIMAWVRRDRAAREAAEAEAGEEKPKVETETEGEKKEKHDEL